jgi:hypothetical protein
VDSIEDGTKIRITRITTILPTLEKPRESIRINRDKVLLVIMGKQLVSPMGNSLPEGR